MKLPPHIYLEERNIPYEAKSFSPETEKGAANVAHALGFSERQAVKTLIFQVDTGERVLVMLGGDQNAISGNLKKAIGSRNIRMAEPDVVKETTGYVIGIVESTPDKRRGVPPRLGIAKTPRSDPIRMVSAISHVKPRTLLLGTFASGSVAPPSAGTLLI